MKTANHQILNHFIVLDSKYQENIYVFRSLISRTVNYSCFDSNGLLLFWLSRSKG